MPDGSLAPEMLPAGPPEPSIPRDDFAPEVLDDPISHTPLDASIVGNEPSEDEIRAMIESMGQSPHIAEEPVRQAHQRPEKSRGKIGQFMEQHQGLGKILKLGMAPLALVFAILFGAMKASKGGNH